MKKSKKVKEVTIFENTGTAMAIIDEDMTITLVNQEFENLSGYQREKIEGRKKWTEFVAKENLERMKEYHRRRRVDPAACPRNYEFKFIDKEGAIREVFLTVAMIPETKESVASLLDVTEQKKREKRLQAVEEVSRQLKLAERKEDIYDLVMDFIKEVLGYFNCAILEKKGNLLEMVRQRGYTSVSVGYRLPLDGKGVTVATFKRGEPIYVPDVEEDDRYIEGASGTRCEYSVPIVAGERAYGILDIENDEVDSIPAHDRSLLQILASELAVALRGLERLEELNESRTKLRELHAAVDRLQTCSTEEELCQTAVEAAERILDFDMSALDLVEGNWLIPKATSTGVSPDEAIKHRIGEGIAGKTVERGETIWGDDIRKYGEAKPTRDDFRSFISVPIGALGILQIVSTQVGKFTQEDVDYAEILAGHLTEEIKRIRLEKELRHQAIRDPLTGLYNRRYFNQTIEKEVNRGRRYGHPLGLLMMDINGFKEINDRYSHLTGDEVLKEIAKLLKDNVRDADIVVRYGGDEFLIILPETDGETGRIESRIQKRLEEWNQESDLVDFPLTLSIGSSYWAPQGEREIEEVLKEADRKMYENKKPR